MWPPDHSSWMACGIAASSPTQIWATVGDTKQRGHAAHPDAWGGQDAPGRHKDSDGGDQSGGRPTL
eukprot:7438201-Lingulodinium_polyedra.AAC.1